uniref:Uncharacterized protein n=1 Tax=Opuntia streptacantha TaxID=393608 RepID=A0A7C9CNA5_OPUST
MAPKKKKREPPDSFMSGILMPSVHCLSLPPNCSARSGVHLPCAVLNCSSLGRCSTLLRSQSLIRTLRVSTSKPFLAFVVDLIAHVGSVGVTLGSSNVGLNVIPEWQLPPVSPQFRRLVFRFALQVSFLPLFSSPFRVNSGCGSYLTVIRLKPTLIQIGFWFNSDNVLLYFCWMLIKLGYYQDKSCRILDQFVMYNLSL